MPNRSSCPEVHICQKTNVKLLLLCGRMLMSGCNIIYLSSDQVLLQPQSRLHKCCILICQHLAFFSNQHCAVAGCYFTVCRPQESAKPASVSPANLWKAKLSNKRDHLHLPTWPWNLGLIQPFEFWCCTDVNLCSANTVVVFTRKPTVTLSLFVGFCHKRNCFVCVFVWVCVRAAI